MSEPILCRENGVYILKNPDGTQIQATVTGLKPANDQTVYVENVIVAKVQGNADGFLPLN